MDLSYSSLQKIRSAERFVAEARILKNDIATITHRDLERLRNDALQTRKVGTVQEYFRVIRAVFEEALKDEVIDESPFMRLRRLRQSDEAPELRVEPFSREELSRLLAVTNIENHRLMIEFLFWTGMRIQHQSPGTSQTTQNARGVQNYRIIAVGNGSAKTPARVDLHAAGQS